MNATKSCMVTPDLKFSVQEATECRNNSDDGGCNRINKIMDDKGFPGVGRGIHRTVHRFEDNNGNRCVVKIPRDNYEGRDANLEEIDRWNNTIPKKVKKYFNPVTDYNKDGEYLIQPRVNVSEIDGETRNKISEYLQSKLEKHGLRCRDLHNENVGVSDDGKIVIIDYGFGTEGTSRTCRIVNSKTIKLKQDLDRIAFVQGLISDKEYYNIKYYNINHRKRG